jgi:hypothetical protein
VVGFTANADGSASIQDVSANNGAMVTFTATSVTGQTAQCTTAFTVVDTTAPVVSCAISHAQVQCGTNTVSVSAEATDTCSTAVSACTCPAGCTGCVVNADGSVTLPGVLANNGVVITCQATDASGNTGTCTETVRVVDTAGPEVGAPTTYTIPCDGQTHEVTAADCGVDNIQDVCDGCAATPTLVSVDVDEACECSTAVTQKTASSVYLLGAENGADGRVYLLNWQLTDKAGNSANQQCLVYVGNGAQLSPPPTYQC